MSDGTLEIQVVGAIRLALEGASDNVAALGLVKWIVDQAPETDPRDTGSVCLLLEGIRGLGYSVSTASPFGASS